MEIKDLPLKIREKASTLKKKWPNIYCLKLKDTYMIVRPMTRGEFLFFLDLSQYMLGLEEDFVFDECVLYPKFNETEKSNSHAGLVADTVKTIQDISAFLSPDNMEDMIVENRNKMELADSQILATVCKAFPQLTVDKINNFDAQKLAYYLALAEEILGVKLEFTKQTEQKQNSTIDFMTENKDLKGQGFGNGFPRGKNTS
ncbi:hypothetical protein DRQ25_11645 [Candidatus Fermentibacteria bacterium]|nr:MAG: hypothetical protein DRQ25_11645 [Candidatus Fermentibacteria bacterium]